MAKHRFPCPKCTHEILVSLTQSGQELSCPQCNHRFEAPKLQELRAYPVEEAGIPAPQLSDQRLNRSIFAAGVILLILFGGATLGLQIYSRQLIDNWDLNELEQYVSDKAEKLVPAEIIQQWYQLEHNPDLREWQEHPAIRNRTQGKFIQKFSYGAGAVAALGLLMTLFSPLFKKK